MKLQLNHSAWAFCLTFLLGSLSTAQSAPGQLSNSPLFLKTSVPPNVLFMNDDSNSMLAETMINNPTGSFKGTQPDGSSPDGSGEFTPVREGCSSPFAPNYTKIVVFTSASKCGVPVEDAWRIRNSTFNPLYYDPEKTYEAWDGYDQAVITHAPDNPYNPQHHINLLTQNSISEVDGKGFRYYTWTDANSNGLFDNGEETEYLIKHQGLAAKKNFANWFTYHRNREFVAKYAISKIINNTPNIRFGFANINDDTITNTIQANDADKSTLLSAVQDHPPVLGATPLHTALSKAGEYYNGNLAGLDSPVLSAEEGGACQIHNTILMTDGYYDTPSINIGDIDADGASNTLADVAAKYYDVDGILHMNTYTVGFGVDGTLPADTNVYADDFSWPDPSSSNAAKIDDLWHAAVNGHGQYLNANDSDSLVNALTDAVEEITSQIPSATSVSMSSFRLTAGSKVFFSSFNPSDWSGDLLAFEIGSDGSLAENTVWTAASQLDNNDDREIFTYSGGAGVAFQWDNIGSTLQNELIAVTNPEQPDIDRGEARLDYLRGETVTDFTFRERGSVLGDIINSSPVYVGAPSSPYPNAYPFGEEGYRYNDFWETYNTTPRTPVVYVGANDGMLHGFNADTGAEVMAYVPATVFPNLKELTDTNYIHHNFVNQTPTVADAYFAHGATVANESWKTVLVSGLGSGGKGLFALDVTAPSNFSETNAANTVLWEFNANDEIVDLDNDDPDNNVYSDLGYTFSQPVIGITEEGRWAVFVGNGYNSDSGIATLFIIYLDADPSDAGGWELDVDYRKISTQVGSHADADKNGLSSPTAIDSDGNGMVDRVYAGDLEGNMWAFDLANSTATGWDVAYQDSSSEPRPLFKATDATDVAQPITVKPSIIRHPDQATINSEATTVNTSPNLLVLFGTGQYLTADDLDNTQEQSFYGVWDKGQDDDTLLTRANLTKQTISTGTGINNSEIEARITSSEPVPYGDADNSQRFGWHFDFPTNNTASERVVSNAVVINNIVFFTTYTPNPDTCGTGGSSWFMFVDAATGAVPDAPVVDISGDQQVDDTNDLAELTDGTESAASGLRIEAGTLGSPALDLGGLEDGDTGTALINTANGVENLATDVGSLRGKRISWRELRQQ